MVGSQAAVYLVDDDEAVRDSLSLSLQQQGWSVEAYDSADAFLSECDPQSPGCLVLDVRMPGISGPELQEMLASNAVKIPIIFISGHGDIPMCVRAIKAGAIDFLEKPFNRDALLQRVAEAVAYDAECRGQDTRQREVSQRFARLTPREQQVMALVVKGLSNKEIGRELDRSHRTVDVHRARVMQKMQAGTLAELVSIAVRCGLHPVLDDNGLSRRAQ